MYSIKAEPRTVFGKKLKKGRAAGKLPAVLYGPKEKPSSWFVALNEFKKLLRQAGESTVVQLQMPQDTKDVLIHEVFKDPVTSEPLHADFYAVDKTKTIEVRVPLKFVGTAPAVKELGGTLVKVLQELTVETLPLQIPHEIEVDITTLINLESQIAVKDLPLPNGARAVNDPDDVVATVAMVKEEAVAETPVDLSAIEVEKKGKREEAEEGVTGAGETTAV